MMSVSCISAVGRTMLLEAGLVSGACARRIYVRTRTHLNKSLNDEDGASPEAVLGKVWNMLFKGLAVSRGHEVRLEHSPLTVIDSESALQMDKKAEIIRFIVENQARAKVIGLEDPQVGAHLVLLDWNASDPKKSKGYMFSKNYPQMEKPLMDEDRDVPVVIHRISENGVLSVLPSDFSLLGKIIPITEMDKSRRGAKTGFQGLVSGKDGDDENGDNGKNLETQGFGDLNDAEMTF